MYSNNRVTRRQPLAVVQNALCEFPQAERVQRGYVRNPTVILMRIISVALYNIIRISDYRFLVLHENSSDTNAFSNGTNK